MNRCHVKHHGTLNLCQAAAKIGYGGDEHNGCRGKKHQEPKEENEERSVCRSTETTSNAFQEGDLLQASNHLRGVGDDKQEKQQKQQRQQIDALTLHEQPSGGSRESQPKQEAQEGERKMNPCSFQALFPDEFLWNARKESFLCRQSNCFAELGLQPGVREEEKDQTDCSHDETVVRRKQEQVPRKLFFAGRAEKEIGLHAVGNIVRQCFHQSAQGKRKQKQCGENGAQITGKVQR